jgi:hypothetical protein
MKLDMESLELLANRYMELELGLVSIYRIYLIKGDV